MTRSIATSVMGLGLLAASAGGALTGPDLAGGDGFAALVPAGEPQSLRLRTGIGERAFAIDSPGARVSPATRLDPEGSSKGGRAAATEQGWKIHDEFVVRAATREPIEELLDAGLIERFEPIDGAPRAWRARTSSVLEAIELAALVRDDPRVDDAFVAVERPVALRSLPTDPLFEDQWHLDNASNPLFDVNAGGAWSLGYTGAGVVVGIVEGRWQHDHPDLAPAFNALASQSGGSTDSNHATSVAGVVGARASNFQGVAGMSYGCELSNQIIGSDAQTASALGFANDINDVKNNSWGPLDNGYIHTISQVELDAIVAGVTSGRAGLGEIYVWAAGNGSTNDRVDYDPFASSRYTIAIGAITDGDVRAPYNEQGSSMFAVAQSNGGVLGITTTQFNSDYTDGFGGTSAASPLAAGVVACMLEANPSLTWRDAQHILADTARRNDPQRASWTQNGAGRWHSYDYGFGAIDAGGAVAAAVAWDNVGPELVADSGVVPVNLVLPDDDPAGVTRTVEIVGDVRIEAVELILNVQTDQVGDLRVTLTSPAGTESLFKKPNFLDSQNDLDDYVFTTVRSWGESSPGTWTVTIADDFASDIATWVDFRVVAYGTANVPTCPGDVTTTGSTPGQPAFGQPDGVTDLADLLFFVDLWQAEIGDALDSETDVTTTGAAPGDPGFGQPDAEVNVSDLLYFVNEWEQGRSECP